MPILNGVNYNFINFKNTHTYKMVFLVSMDYQIRKKSPVLILQILNITIVGQNDDEGVQFF
jgi:hypothetical protein